MKEGDKIRIKKGDIYCSPSYGVDENTVLEVIRIDKDGVYTDCPTEATPELFFYENQYTLANETFENIENPIKLTFNLELKGKTIELSHDEIRQLKITLEAL